jgi:hypothetical protein
MGGLETTFAASLKNFWKSGIFFFAVPLVSMEGFFSLL